MGKRPSVRIAAVLLFAGLALLIGGCGADAPTTATSAGSAATPGGTNAAAAGGSLPGVVVQTQSGQGSYRNITADELAAMLKAKDFLLVNTHVPYEGEIEGTDLFLDYQRAEELMTELPRDKDAKIVVYCRSDRMSTIAAEVWADGGYTNLYQLIGGFVDWEARGFPLLQLQR